MSTRIVFNNGLNVIVAQDEPDVVRSSRGEQNPVTLEGRSASRLHINWDHVVFVRGDKATLGSPPTAG